MRFANLRIMQTGNFAIAMAVELRGSELQLEYHPADVL